MSETTRKSLAFFDRLLDGSVWVGGILLAFCWFGVLFEIFMRQVFNRPQPGIDDISTVFMLYITVLPSAWLLRRGRHVIVDIVVQQINKKTRNFINITISIVFAAVCLVVAYYGGVATLRFFWRGFEISGNIQVKMWFVIWVIPVGFFLLAIQFVREAYAHWQRKKDLGVWEGDLL
jgi:TRAP-type C4-dicarboxylate transport system permease small subunit